MSSKDLSVDLDDGSSKNIADITDTTSVFCTPNTEANIQNTEVLNTSITSRYIVNMPKERTAAYYNMRHKNRGLALIFNHHIFDKNLKERNGTDVDCKRLKQVLEQLMFEVKVFPDCTLKELELHIEAAAQQDHSNNDCILIAIMSHGSVGCISAKDTEYKLDTVWNYFTDKNCPTLADKPKLFFVQACQGTLLNAGDVKLKTQTDDGNASCYTMPVHADILIANSTPLGFYSWRNQANGSWFVQSLCAELERNAKHYDLVTLMTFVCQRVAIDYESNNKEWAGKKQSPCITSTLTRILMFSDNL